jgi:MinD-like ATPase involved in chromosome partitioning or flagellar assembly
VQAVLGRAPDVFIPSDREIPRSVNEGVPIVMARPEGEPAIAFRQLADMLSGSAAGDGEVVPVGVAAAQGGQRLRRFGKKAQ